MQPLTAQQLVEKRWLASPAAFAAALSMGRWRRARHLNLLSTMLARVLTQRRKRIIVSMPPRHGKSELTSHWFPAWYLELAPRERVILASYEADFASSWGRKVRNTLTEHEADLLVRISSDSSAADRWDTTEGGGMMTAGAGGPITGKGAHLLLVDDPIKNAEDAASQTIRDKIWDWWTSTAYTRLEPDGSAVVVMTRWHEDDLVGRLLAEAKNGGEQWEVIEFPAICDTEGDALGRVFDEPLWPDRYSAADMARIKTAVGSYVWNALYQQRPTPLEGGMFKRDWWRFWRVLPAKFDEVIQSWDMTFKDGKKNDFVVGEIWGRIGAAFYLLDQIRARMDFPTTQAAVRSFSAKWPQAVTKLVEDKANGPAIISSLKKEISGLVEVEPDGSKEARAAAVSPLVEAGNVYLPDPTIAPWVHDYIEELSAFPSGANDDQVDATSQALKRLGLKSAPPQFRQQPGQFGPRRTL